MSNSLAGSPRPGGGPTRQQLDELDALLQRMLDLPVSQGDEPEEPEPVAPPPPAPRTARTIPAPEPNLPPVRYYEPEYDDEEESPAEPIAPRVAFLEPPVPGGRHDLEEDTPVDPSEELARIRAAMQQQADRQARQPAEPPAPPAPPRGAQGEWVPLRSAWQPSEQTWKPLAERWEQGSRPPAPAPPAGPTPAPPPRRAQQAPPAYPPSIVPAGPVIVTQTFSEPDSVPVIPPPPRINPMPEPQPAAAAPVTTAPEAVAPATSWTLLPLVWFNSVFDVVLLPWCPRGRWLRGPAGRKALGVLGVGCLLAAVGVGVADWFGWIW